MNTVQLVRNPKLIPGTFVKVGNKALVRCPDCKKLTMTKRDVTRKEPIPFLCDHCSWSVIISFQGFEK